MRSAILALSALVMLAAVAQASVLDNTAQGVCRAVAMAVPALDEPLEGGEECATQYDGGQHGDASDDCKRPSPDLGGAPTNGLLVPLDDPADNYALAVVAGQARTVVLRPSPLLGGGIDLPTGPVPGPSYVLTVYEPGCGRSLGSATATVGGGAAVSFEAAFSGRYVVSITPGPAQVAIGLPGGPTTDTCHPFCFGVLINPALGYGVSAAGG